MLPPEPRGRAAWNALTALLHGRSVLASLEALHGEMGDVFEIPLPGFRPIMLVGPEANRFVLVTAADRLRWRLEGDPVRNLFGDGLLMLDGARHDAMRAVMSPALHRRTLNRHVTAMWRAADRVSRRWPNGGVVDMLVEMRRMALLILVDTLFGADLGPELRRLWPSILKTLEFISPGVWLVWRGAPRPGYQRARRALDGYLFALIRARTSNEQRATSNEHGAVGGDDLLALLIDAGLDDRLIRDQLVTMLVAGHDTSTALLAWALWLLGRHPDVLRRAHAEVDRVLAGGPPTAAMLGELAYLDQVIDETMRLYPPIHIGNRTAATDLEFGGYRIPAGRRVLYSTYLTHRDPACWPDPARFDPDRFSPEGKRGRTPYSYLPFGGGRRNCIGFAFAEVEARVVLARVLQTFDFRLVRPTVRAHMGATLAPRPGVPMRVTARLGQGRL